MTASLQREEMQAFSDGAALLGAVVCGAIGLVWAVAGRDTGMVIAGSILVIASAMAGVYLIDRFRGKAPPVEETGYADGVIRAGVIATVFWGLAGFLVGDIIAWQLAFPFSISICNGRASGDCGRCIPRRSFSPSAAMR